MPVLQIFRSVVDDPVADCCPAPPRRRGGRIIISFAPIARAPSSPQTEITKMESATSSAAAAPPRRLEQVGLRQSSLESARASRAREGNDTG